VPPEPYSTLKSNTAFQKDGLNQSAQSVSAKITEIVSLMKSRMNTNVCAELDLLVSFAKPTLMNVLWKVTKFALKLEEDVLIQSTLGIAISVSPLVSPLLKLSKNHVL